jgi:hypothetical protein
MRSAWQCSRPTSPTLPDRPLRILDIGAGLGHMACGWRGHQLTLAEPPSRCSKAPVPTFAEAGVQATFIQAPWQDLLGQLTEPTTWCCATRCWNGWPNRASCRYCTS